MSKTLKMNRLSILMVLVVSIFQSCYYDNKDDLYQHVQQVECAVDAATYSGEVLPILITHCDRCHNNDRADGGVNLAGYANAKRHADNGSLYGTTAHLSGYPVMPTSGIRIPPCEIATLKKWIDNGALEN